MQISKNKKIEVKSKKWTVTAIVSALILAMTTIITTMSAQMGSKAMDPISVERVTSVPGTETTFVIPPGEGKKPLHDPYEEYPIFAALAAFMPHIIQLITALGVLLGSLKGMKVVPKHSHS